jgi:type IV secretion system protein VirB2
MGPILRERFRLQDAATVAALTFLFVVAGADAAFATPAGAAMPWDTPLTNLLNNLQGTVARIAITVAIVLTGLIFAFGEAGSGLRKVMGIAFGGALALGALTFMTALGGRRGVLEGEHGREREHHGGTGIPIHLALTRPILLAGADRELTLRTRSSLRPRVRISLSRWTLGSLCLRRGSVASAILDD